MKKTKKNNISSVSVPEGWKTAEVVAEARRLTDSIRRLGIPKPKSEYNLAPPLGTTLTRASRYRAL